MPLGTICNPCPQTLGDCVNPNSFLYDLWTVFEQWIFQSFPSDAFGENRPKGGRASRLSTLWLLKRTQELIIFNPMSPFKICTRTLYKRALYTPEHSLQLLSWGLWWGMSSSNTKLLDISITLNKMASSWLDACGEIMGVEGGGAGFPKIILNHKKRP